tara:strand:- start:708 stop:1214 length:507 start_codon:yes stop_codon:yes gene_type:complete
MKYLKLLFISILIVSCTNVQFVDSQPEFLERLSEIPEKFQGTFIEVSVDTTTYVVTATSILEDGKVQFKMDSTMEVKGHGNTLYLNTNGSHGFECHRVTLVRSFNYEKINLSSINIVNAQMELKNIKYESIEKSDESNQHIFIIKDINYNQLQKLFEGSSKQELIRIK